MESTSKHTHRDAGSLRYHIMRYRDLALCGQYIASPVKATEPVSGMSKCVACSTADKDK